MIEQLITDHLDLWSSAVRPKSSAGRGSNSKLELTGIKKLRELILELAVRGKLVPQDPNDEPASVLLERIAAEKARLVKKGKIKKEKAVSSISETELPISQPKGWAFERFANVLINRDFERIPLSVTEREKRKGDYDYYGASGVIDKIDGYLFDKPLLLIGEDGANLINRSTPIAFIARGKYWVNNHAHVLDAISEELLMYVCLHINAISLEPYVTGTAQPKMNQAKMNEILLGIPPVAEQKRIVAKVDELMSLCDQLEQQSEASLAAHQTLVETLLATLTDSADSSELAQNWARLAQYFDSLFTTQSSIDALKQTILQLAVMGKLVPQDPNDEPASVLLERIAAEKARLVKEGKIKKEKPLPPISEEEKPFALPDGWEWCYVGMIADVKGGYAFKSGDFIVAGNAQVIRMGNVKPDELRLNENPVFISNALADASCGFELFKSDILLTMTGTKGKRDYLYSLVLEQDDFQGKRLYINQRLCCFRPFIVDSGYINFVIKDARLMDSMYKKSTGTANQANIGMDALLKWVIPIPPINEQHRILVKVKELMSLCDQLSARLQASQTTQLHLAEALVEGALN